MFLGLSNKNAVSINSNNRIKNGAIIDFDISDPNCFGIARTRNFVKAKIYSSYSAALRSANYVVQWSDNNVNWVNAFGGVASNNNSCGIQENTGVGDGSYGHHLHWRYVVRGVIAGHHPMVSRLILTDINDVDYNIAIYASDNCANSGQYNFTIVNYLRNDIVNIPSIFSLIDLSKNNNTGVLNGPSFNFDTENRPSLSFDGSNDYVRIASPNNFPTSTNDFSINCWIKPNVIAGDVRTICSNQTLNDFELVVTAAGGIQFYLGGSLVIDYATSIITTNNYHHVGIVRSGNNFSLYHNGKKQITSSNSGAITSTTDLDIGYRKLNNQDPFNGKISQFSIYNRALSDSEVQNNFIAGLEFNPNLSSSIVNYYTLNLLSNANLTITNNNTTSVNVFKTASNNSWNSHAYSELSFKAPCTIEFNKQAAATDNSVSYAQIGWNEDPLTGTDTYSLDYASYPYMTNAYAVVNSGEVIPFDPAVTWDAAQKFYIVYTEDGYIKHYNGSKLLYSAFYGLDRRVYLDSSFYSANSTYGGFSNIRICGRAWNGTSYF